MDNKIKGCFLVVVKTCNCTGVSATTTEYLAFAA